MTVYDQIQHAFKKERDFAKAEKLIASDPAFLKYDNQGIALFESAARRGDVQALALLAKYGVDVNATQSSALGWGPIDDAVISGHHEAVLWLINNGALVNVVCEGQRHSSALMGACLWGYLNCVRVLVENGAELNATWKGKTALCIAEERGHVEIAQYLRSKGAKTPQELEQETTKPIKPKPKRKK